MKKLLTIILSAALILSTTACGFNSELEALKKENEKTQSTVRKFRKKGHSKTYAKFNTKPNRKSIC